MSNSLRSTQQTRRLGLLFVAMVWLSAGASAAGARTAPKTTPDSAAGRYAVLRVDDKDTGCMLTLEARAARGPGGFKAQLAPACRDNGVVIFDPVGWSIERGRLALTARKGHKTYFDREASGIWRRDAKEGKALSLRPL